MNFLRRIRPGSRPISHHASLASDRAPARAGKAHLRYGRARAVEQFRQIVRAFARPVGDEGQGVARERLDEWQGQGGGERTGPAGCTPLRDVGTRTEEFPGRPRHSSPRKAGECAYELARLECSRACKGREPSGVGTLCSLLAFIITRDPYLSHRHCYSTCFPVPS